jgi:signal transduction histidine kinase
VDERLRQLGLRGEDYRGLVQAIVAAVAPLVGATAGGVHLRAAGADGEHLQLLPGSFGLSDEMAASFQVSTSSQESSAARVFTTGQSFMSNDPINDPATIPSYVSVLGIRGIISTRIALREPGTGVLHIANKASEFTTIDVRRIETVAPLVASAVEHMRLITDLRRERALESYTATIATGIVAGHAIEEVAPALRGFCRTIEGEAIVLAVMGRQSLVLATSRSAPDEEFLRASRLVGSQLSSGKLRENVSRPMRAGDTGHATIHAPVLVDGVPVAMLSLLRRRGEPLSDGERAAVIRLANVASLSWVSEEYRKRRAEAARERERRRIADELHDHVAQLLFAAKMRLDVAVSESDIGPNALAAVTEAIAQVTQCEAGIREVVTHLSGGAPVATSLEQRLAATVEAAEDEFGLMIQLIVSAAEEAEASGCRDLSPGGVEAAVRATREALVNVAKHAGPCAVRVVVRRDAGRRVVISVADSGRGIDPAAGTGFGLRSARRYLAAERGRLSVRCRNEGGTEVTISVPISHHWREARG